MAWLMLVVAGLLEVVWAMALKSSDGFRLLVPTLIGLGGAMASFALLAVALKHLPAGTGYAVWVGIGAVGVAIAGMVFLGEEACAARLVCLALIVVGVVGLRVVDG
jgi:quaternary ammonium compound-resistance protein SugE